MSKQSLARDELVQSSLLTDAVMSPRIAMFGTLPSAMQPFLTWLTAKPGPGETIRERSPLYYVWVASLQIVVGVGLTCFGVLDQSRNFVACFIALDILGLILTTSGLGLFQVVVFHHCSHGTVFLQRDTNIAVGRLISTLFLFQHFDHYKTSHMMHHNNNKLLTEEDEFADFVFSLCGLRAGLSKRQLWLRVAFTLASPQFHLRFLWKRLRGAWWSHDLMHNIVGVSVWGCGLATAFILGHLSAAVIAWVLPVTVLLQIATVFRILCEHRFPDPEIIALRGRDFACHATAGVFPGKMPPSVKALSPTGLLLWAGWWTNLLTVQLLVRVLVLVGDAPCHDYHHRRPASRRWTSYIQARQIDLESTSAGPRPAYMESWGLFTALDQNLASLARTPADFISLGQGHRTPANANAEAGGAVTPSPQPTAKTRRSRYEAANDAFGGLQAAQSF